MSEPRLITAAEVHAGESGDVQGPDTAADGNIALFDGTTGKLLKAAGVVEGVATIDSTTNILKGDGSGNAIDSNVAIVGNTGTQDLFIGRAAGGTPSASSTAVGDGALSSSTGFGSNTAIGANTLFGLVTGTNNVAVGDSALGSIVDGSNNVAIGSASAAAGDNNQCVSIGSSTDAIGTNAIAIGFGVQVESDNSVQIGNEDIIDFRIGACNFFVNPTGVGGDGSQLIFPDSDPHIAGAGYWVDGVLTKSTG